MKAWITALVIAYFEENFGEQKELWEMIIVKAKELVNDENVVEKAKLVFKKI